MTATDTLPTLTGTPRQTAWAEQLRAGLDTAIAREVEHRFLASTDYKRDQAHRILAPAMRAAALGQTDANWWIDNRGGRAAGTGIALRTLGRAAWLTIPAEQRAALTAQCNTIPQEPTTARDIIAALRAAGESARDIAAAVGVHVSTVYRWARGAFNPTATRYTVLAALI